METEKRPVFAKAWECKGRGVNTKGQERIFWGDINVLNYSIGYMTVRLSKFIKLYM